MPTCFSPPCCTAGRSLCAIRGASDRTPVKDVPKAIPIGKAELLQHGDHDQVAIFALAALIPMAKEIARKLEGEGYSAAVINARFTKPIDVEMLEFYAASVDVILTLEDHVLKGGFGSAVLEELNNLGLDTPVVRIGWPDRFIEHGKPEALRAKYGISVEAALEKLRVRLKASARPASAPEGQPSFTTSPEATPAASVPRRP